VSVVADIRARRVAGDTAGALALARQAAVDRPDDVSLQAVLGSLLAQSGQAAEAVEVFHRVLTLDPEHLDACFDLSALILREQPELAAGLLARVIAAQPGDVDARVNRGVALASAGRWVEATAELEAAVGRAPGRADAWMALATARATRALHTAASVAYDQALTLEPLRGPWWTRAGWHALTTGDLRTARERFEQGAVLLGDDPEPIAGLAMVDDREGRAAEGLARLGPHLGEAAGSPRVAEALGQLSLRLGQPDAAVALVRAARAACTDPGASRRLDYTLGALLDATGDGERALACWVRAGRASPFVDQPDRFDRDVASVRAHHRPETLAPGPDAGPGPVFIVGMPRTGTSLLEQMLDRHPLVSGAGELQAGVDMAEGLGPAWPERLTTLDDAALSRLAAHWRASAAAVVGEQEDASGGVSARCITDKLPLNSLHLGVLARALPGARVLWCLRDPRDLAVSNLAQPFSGPRYAWATSLSGIARRVSAHHRLACHWAESSPVPLRFVRYEALVDDPEVVMGGVLGFLELPPEPACLAPHRSERRLNTASFAQIREPIHTRSVGRWKRCGPAMEAFAQALGPLVDPASWPDSGEPRASSQ